MNMNVKYSPYFRPRYGHKYCHPASYLEYIRMPTSTRYHTTGQIPGAALHSSTRVDCFELKPVEETKVVLLCGGYSIYGGLQHVRYRS